MPGSLTVLESTFDETEDVSSSQREDRLSVPPGGLKRLLICCRQTLHGSTCDAGQEDEADPLWSLLLDQQQGDWITVKPRLLPTAAAVKTHVVTWAANMVVQEAMPSSYYDHDVNTLGVFSLQHNGRQHGETDGVCFNTLVALTPDRVQRNEDGEKVEWTGTGEPPPVENPRYVWFKVQKQTLKQKLMEMTKNTSILPIHSLY